MTFRHRILVLPISAVIIVTLVGYKLTRTYPEHSEGTNYLQRRLAPEFHALDSDNQLFNLNASFLGRHRIVLVFFDGEAGVGSDAALRELKQNHEALRSAGYIVLAISTALPQTNRKEFEAAGKFPFPVLSDPALHVHRMWGRITENGKPIAGLFLIDRAGQVAWKDDHPVPEENAMASVLQIINDN